MSLFDKIFSKKNDGAIASGVTFKTLTAYAPAFYTFGGSVYESELVRSAIDTIARNVGKLEVVFNGNANIAKLRSRPNGFQTWYQFLYRLTTILMIHNTAFVVPIYDSYGQLTGIYPVLPSSVTVVEYHKEPWLVYRFANGEKAAEQLSKCAVMLRHQYQSDLFGETNQALLPTMDLISIDNQGIQEAVKSSATYRFMAQLANFSAPEKLQQERKNFSEINMKAEDAAGGLLLFPNTWKDIKQIDSKPFTVDPEERKLIQTNVYNYFGVNEDVIQNRAYGDAWSAFYEGCIEPIAIQFSECMSHMLYTPRELAGGSFVTATANRLQYLSNSEKLNVSSQMLDRGIMSINDVRAIWNLPPVEGGDVRIIRGEYWNADEKVSDDGVE